MSDYCPNRGNYIGKPSLKEILTLSCPIISELNASDQINVADSILDGLARLCARDDVVNKFKQFGEYCEVAFSRGAAEVGGDAEATQAHLVLQTNT